MESRNIVKCLFGGVALGVATTYFLSGSLSGKQNEPYYNGLYEDEEIFQHQKRRDSGNMPPSYLHDSPTNVELKNPNVLHTCKYDKIRHYFE